MEFAPHGSLFVLFRKPIPADAAGKSEHNFPKLKPAQEITGAWTVKFDPKWGGPESIEFANLEGWNKRPEDGIKHYSGTATYLKRFDLQAGLENASRLYLDLGEVKNLAEVRLNGNNLGVLWTAPWRVEITSAVRPAGNVLEIEVVNLWPNRLLGDQALVKEKRFTRTNVSIDPKMPLLPSGLLGPVTIQTSASIP